MHVSSLSWELLAGHVSRGHLLSSISTFRESGAQRSICLFTREPPVLSLTEAYLSTYLEIPIRRIHLINERRCGSDVSRVGVLDLQASLGQDASLPLHLI